MFFNDSPSSEEKLTRVTKPSTSGRSAKPTTLEELFRFEGPPDAMVTVGGRSYIYFAGEGYLGLQANPEVLAAACEAVLQYGVSSVTTRRQFTPTPIIDVERFGAHIFSTAKAFYSTGEDKLIELVLESLSESFDRIFIDEGCNVILLRALRREIGDRIPVHQYRHRDVIHLAALLKKENRQSDRPLVITEGVFSSSGTIAPLDRYMALLTGYKESGILIEDSHGFGVLGKTGRGTLEHFGWDVSQINRTRNDLPNESIFMNNRRPSGKGILYQRRKGEPLPVRTYWTASLGKAIGGFGAILPGSDLFVERISELAIRAGIGVPPTPAAAATGKCLELSFTNPELRKKLLTNTQYLKKGLRQLGFLVEDNPVPIISLKPGCNSNMRRIQQTLGEKQFLISYLPRQKDLGSQGALRMTVFATHTKTMLAAFLKALTEAVV